MKYRAQNIPHLFTQVSESKIGEWVSADIREGPDGSFSFNLNLPAIRTIFMGVVDFKERLVDKLDHLDVRIHRSNSRCYSRCGRRHGKAIKLWINLFNMFT